MENTLELRVISSSVGVLETSIGTLEDYVARKLVEYNPENYEGDADSAKKDRAELNKAEKQIAAERKRIIDEMMKPYSDFETRCKKLEKDIKTASGKLDEIVKVKENEEKEAKKVLCKMVWDEKKFDLFPMDKIFNPKWLNKGTKKSTISDEMDAIISKVYKDLKTIERFAEDAELLKAMYLDDLDLEAVFSKADELEKNRKKVAEESATRESRELEKAKEEQAEEVERELEQHRKDNIKKSLVLDALEMDAPSEEAEDYVLSFKATKAEVDRLKMWLVDNGIYFDSLKVNGF